MPELEIHYADDWAALYVDGKLDRIGKTYNIEERALELCGVNIVDDDAFLLGQTGRDAGAQTLDEVAAYTEKRDRAAAEAAAKVEQARALLAEAEALDPTGRTGRL